MGEAEVRQAFLKQAPSCESLGSSFTARLCRIAASALDRSTGVGRVILDWPRDASGAQDAVALRLAGSLHALVLSGSDPALVAAYPPNEISDAGLWATMAAAFVRHEAFILDRLTSAPQTNEVRRSATLLPGFLTIAAILGKPLRLLEIGASAGLNLQWDSYRYSLGGATWGDPASPVHLAPNWQGALPPKADIHVAGRAACDLNPLDPSSPEDRLRLLSYIWADQADRLERTRAALAIAAENRIEVTRADALTWLKAKLAQSAPGVATVVYHSIAWQYLPVKARSDGEAIIAEAGSRATDSSPLARLQMEADVKPDSAALTLQLWPAGEARELGRADFHGRWVSWQGWN
jgi:hypothetical protein